MGKAKTRELTHHVAHNKIFVDTEGIRTALGDGFADRVWRCKVLASLPGMLRDGIAVVGGTTVGNKNVDVVATDEAFRTFRALFNEVRQYFTSSNEYGLDANLSQRIRHGALLGEVRANFEPFHLLTEQSEGVYALNEYWMSRFGPSTPESQTKASEILQELSRSVDTLARKVRDQWVQVRGPANSLQGMFDFDFDDDQLRAAFSKVATVASIEAFQDLIFDVLWDRMDGALAKVRAAVSSTLRDEVLALLDSSLMKLAEINPPIDLNEYRRTLTTAKTQLDYAFQSIADWFRVDQAQLLPPFRLSELLDALMEQVGKYCGPAKLTVEKSIQPNLLLDGYLFRPFWDLLFIFFDNAARYANRNPALVRIAVKEQPDRMLLEISNETGATDDLEELEKRAVHCTAAASIGRPSEMFRREGRSGFPKVAKILRYDFQCLEQDVAVRIDNQRWFCVGVKMAADGIYAENFGH